MRFRILYVVAHGITARHLLVGQLVWMRGRGCEVAVVAAPTVIVEELLHGDGSLVPPDYKLFCFGGEPLFIQVDRDRYGSHKRALYTTTWEAPEYARTQWQASGA